MRDSIWGAEFEHERRMSEIRGRSFCVKIPKAIQDAQREFNRMNEVIYEKRCPVWGRKEKTMNLYEIFVVYAVEGLQPIIRLPKAPFYYGQNEEEAKIHSRAIELIEPEWDPEGVTVICHELGSFKVKK